MVQNKVPHTLDSNFKQFVKFDNKVHILLVGNRRGLPRKQRKPRFWWPTGTIKSGSKRMYEVRKKVACQQKTDNRKCQEELAEDTLTNCQKP